MSIFFPEQLSWPSTSGRWPTAQPYSGNLIASANNEAQLTNGTSTESHLRGEDSSAHIYGGPASEADRSTPTLSNQDQLIHPIAISAMDAGRAPEETVDQLEYFAEPTSPTSGIIRNSGARTTYAAWWQPRMSFGFLVLLSVVLIIPAFIIVLAFLLIPKYVAADPSYTPLKDQLLTLLSSRSPDGGKALQSNSTPQYSAYCWLLRNGNIKKYGDMQKLQRYALATLYYSLNGESWINRSGWLSDGSECSDWFHLYTVEFCRNGAVIDLNLSGNNVTGTLPDEISLLSSLSTYTILASFMNSFHAYTY